MRSYLFRSGVVLAVFSIGMVSWVCGPGNDTEPPRIVSTEPIPDASDVALDVAVKVRFNEAMDTSSLNASTVLLSCGGDSVSGAVTAAGTQATLTPADDLPAGAGCTATVTTGAMDVAGNGLAADYSWNFTTSGADVTPPVVVSTFPTNGATDVGVGIQVQATFSEVMDVATITDASFTLVCDSTPVTGSVSAGGAEALFTPAADLPHDASCTATLSTDIQDLAGNGLESQYTWSFATEAAPVIRRWGTPQRIENHTGDGKYPEVAMDSDGNAWVVWSQYAGGVYHVWANRFTPGSGWSGEEKIFEDAGPIQYPQVAVNDAGEAMAVGPYTDDLDVYKVWTRRWVDGTDWEASELIGSDSIREYIHSPGVDMDENGNAIAIWRVGEGPQVTHSLVAARYESGTGWGSWEYLETEDNGDATAPRISMTPTGDAFVVWQQFDGVHNSIKSNRYVAGTGWEGVYELDTTDEECSVPQVATNPDGDAMVVWRQVQAAGTDVWARRYAAAGGWETPIQIKVVMGTAEMPRVAMAPDGSAVAAWKHVFDANSHVIAASSFVPSSGWGAEETIGQDSERSQNPFVAMGAAGEAIAVWNRSNIFADHFTPGDGWGEPQVIGEVGQWDHALDPRVVIDSEGRALAVWYQEDGNTSTYDIWANRYE